MQDILTQSLNIANYLASHIPFNAILASGILSPLLAAIKSWLNIQATKKYTIFPGLKFNGEQVMISLVGAVSLLTVSVNYLLHSNNLTTPQFLLIQAAVLAFMTQPVYFLALKPLMRAFSAQLAKAVAISDAKTAAEPVGGLVAPPAADFSQ